MSEQEIIKRYTFNYFSGYGIGNVAAHTIKIYPISVKSTSFEEAVVKAKKKAINASRYNECFDIRTVIQVVEEYKKESKVGLYWIEDNVVKWEGETCYWTPPCFGNTQMQSFNLPSVENHYGSWIADFCWGRVTYSYIGWIKHSLERFDYTKFFSTASKKEQKANYKKYIIDEIQYLLNSKHCPEKDKEILRNIKLLE